MYPFKKQDIIGAVCLVGATALLIVMATYAAVNSIPVWGY